MKRSLYGIGDPLAELNRRTGSIVDFGHMQVEAVRKSSGAKVPVQPFVDGSVEHVSAVLGSHADAVNRASELGNDFVLYPNLTAKNPWPQRILNVGKEWRFDESDDEWRGTLV